MTILEIIASAGLIGIGGTVVLDLVSWALERALGIPATNWAMVGRWVGNMPEGRFIQLDLKNARKVPGELAIGWIVHYAIGLGYGLLLVAITGVAWLQAPTPAAPIALVIVLLVLPYFVMMPGMGMGVAASRAANPNQVRLKSAAGHTVFGLGMYLAAALMATAAA